MKWAFGVIDRDGSGTIEKDELYTGVLLVHLKIASKLVLEKYIIIAFSSCVCGISAILEHALTNVQFFFAVQNMQGRQLAL